MQADLHLATEGQKATMLQLMELYCYDHTDFMTWPIGEDGHLCNLKRFEERWHNSAIEKSFIRVEGRLAGFVWVSENTSVLNPPQTIHDMEEFCVLRGYWRRGIGRQIAGETFRRRPGPWEVRVMQRNQRALAFWRAVIASHSAGHFREVRHDEDHSPRTIFAFDSPSN